MLNLILKIGGLSLGISLGIKYLLPLVPIPQSGAIALGMVLCPTLILVMIFAWQSCKRNPQQS
jgi:hypothetical protein